MFSDGDDCQGQFEAILLFATGLRVPPPLGFPGGALSLTFQQEDGLFGKLLYPMADTCNYTLKLPVTHSSFDSFSEAMSFGIGNSKAFGFA